MADVRPLERGSEAVSDAGPRRSDPRPFFGAELLRSLQLPMLTRRYSERRVVGLYVLVNSGLAIGVMAALAMVTNQPFAFPSLGPTAFLLFYQPLAPNAAPRSCFFGHLIGVLAGYLSLVVFGLTDVPPDLEAFTAARVGALALSLALTLSLMAWLDIPHAPAGATTLIISIGLLRTPEQLAILMLAVVLLTVQGYVINRLAGLPYPRWAPRSDPPKP
jgi:CBS domain-containing membrane protein